MQSNFSKLMKQNGESRFKVLSEIDFVHRRPEILLGTVDKIERVFDVFDRDSGKFVQRKFDFSEAFFRLFEEAVTNSVDEYERHDNLREIRVEVKNGVISVSDDGDGYPQEIYEHEGEDRWTPELILTKLYSGNNFEDNGRETIGQNGCGISLVNFLSTSLQIDTSNGVNRYEQSFENHSRRFSNPKITECDKKFTRISFSPDLCLFKLDEEVYSDYEPLFLEYIRSLSAACPKIKFYFNRERVKTNVGDYIKAMLDVRVICDHREGCDIALGLANECTRNFQMVNSKPISEYIAFSYFQMSVFNRARELLNKRLRLNVARNSWFKENISVVAFFRGTDTHFKNQTKDILVKFDNPNFSFDNIEVEKWACRIAADPDVFRMYSEHFNTKNEGVAARVIKKKIDFVPKLVEASGKDFTKKIILITEGDCLDENTNILVLSRNKLVDKKMSDISVGDIVLTHKRNFKRVTGKCTKKKTGFKVNLKDGNSFVASEDHKMMVYSISTKKISFKAIKDIDLTDDKLVKHKFLT